MNDFINGMSWRHTDTLPIDLTDFTDFPACYSIIKDTLKPGAFIALQFVIEDVGVVFQYRYGYDCIGLRILEGDRVINEFPLFINATGKVSTLPEYLESDESVEEIVKIIVDYGFHAVIGVQWATFLLKENLEGTLDQYFDDLNTQEIH